MHTKHYLTSYPTPLAYLLLALLTLLLTAHSQPVKITPAPGAVGRSPQEIRLTFAEPVTANVNISLTPPDSFTPISGINAQQDPQNPTQIFASLPPLDPGTYTVEWQVESNDGHFVSGFYAFAVSDSIWSNVPLWSILLIISIPILVILVTSRRRTSGRKADYHSDN